MKIYEWKEGMTPEEAKDGAFIFPENYTKTYQKGSEKQIMFILSKDGCWECISHSKNRKGYIDICRNSKRTKIHRYIYEQVNGIVLSDDVVVMHKCDNPACINPNHLDVGDIDKNNKDKTAKNRQVKGESVHTAKLTSNDVARIKIDDRSQRQIALDYGVCHSTIGRIKRRENWKHEDFSLQRRNVG